MMNAWLDNPVMQSAVLPFATAFAGAAFLRRLGRPWAGLGFILAYLAATGLIAGFGLSPLTSTRKILLLALAAVPVALALDLEPARGRIRAWIPALGGAAAVLWVIWPVALRRTGAEFWWLAIPAACYAAWLAAALDGLNDRPVRLLTALTALGAGTGISALLGASALLGQLGGAVAAATGGYLLLCLIARGGFAPGRTLALPATLLCALLGVASTVYARLPWYSLVPLALIPVLARLPGGASAGPIKDTARVMLWTLPATISAILITWRVAGAPPF